MTIALQNTVSFTPVTLIVRVSDRREFTPQRALSCGNTIDQNGCSRLYHQRLRQGLPCPSASSFCRGQIRQWGANPASTIGDTHSIDHFRMRLVRQSATMQQVSIHLTMSGWSEPISSRNSPSGVSQTIWRYAARSILSILSLHFVNVGIRRWSLSEL